MENFMLWLLMLLSGPVEALENPNFDFILENREEIIACAKELQIIDSWWGGSAFHDRDIIVSELQYLYDNYHQLKDVPLVEQFSPKWKIDRPTIARLKQFNLDYLKCLEVRLEWEKDREDIINTIIDETKFLYRVWDTIEDINLSSSSYYSRRLAYQKLKELLGDDFEKEERPEYVPIWRFQNK